MLKPRFNAEPDRVKTNQEKAMACMDVPEMDITCPMKSSLKSLKRKERRAPRKGEATLPDGLGIVTSQRILLPAGALACSRSAAECHPVGDFSLSVVLHSFCQEWLIDGVTKLIGRKVTVECASKLNDRSTVDLRSAPLNGRDLSEIFTQDFLPLILRLEAMAPDIHPVVVGRVGSLKSELQVGTFVDRFFWFAPLCFHWRRLRQLDAACARLRSGPKTGLVGAGLDSRLDGRLDARFDSRFDTGLDLLCLSRCG